MLIPASRAHVMRVPSVAKLQHVSAPLCVGRQNSFSVLQLPRDDVWYDNGLQAKELDLFYFSVVDGLADHHPHRAADLWAMGLSFRFLGVDFPPGIPWIIIL